MATRAGMSNLIERVRGLTNAGTADYTVNELSWFSDDDLQDILDSNAQMLIDSPLTWHPQTIAGSTITWLEAQAFYRDFEEAGSGTARWIVRSSTGAEIGTANYTANYRQGKITFTSDQGGSAYYLTAYTYDLNQAAADVWRHRLANFATWYQFSADNQTFNRQQAFDHAKDMIAEFEKKAGDNVVSNVGGDIRMSQFVRTDVNVSYS